MVKRIKRLEKQKEGLLKQAERHREKITSEKGLKDTTHEYWLKEAEQFEEQARERAEKIEKQKRK